ncbi:MAG: DUF2341 domain-containing protein [archaeon]
MRKLALFLILLACLPWTAGFILNVTNESVPLQPFTMELLGDIPADAYLTITLPDGTLLKNNKLQPTMEFIPQQEGKYLVQLLSPERQELSEATIRVRSDGKNNTQYRTNASAQVNNTAMVMTANETADDNLTDVANASRDVITISNYPYLVGWPMTILLPEGTDVLDIQTPTSQARYLGAVTEPVAFVPREQGNYTIIASRNGETFAKTFIVEEQQPIPRSSIFIGDKEALPVDMTFYASSGKTELVLSLKEQPIRMHFFNLTQQERYVIKFKQVQKFTTIENKQVQALYAIDPSALNFSSATLTIRARGTAVWKCKEWDFDQDTCEGSWQQLLNLTPGQDYTLNLTPEDPGFAETGLATINAKKPIYHPGETAELFMVVLDQQGYLVPDAQLTLAITDPDGNITSDTPITNISRGIYASNYTTQGEGTYWLAVTAVSDSVNYTMYSSFLVNASFPFDIIRETPLTIDPWTENLTSTITVYAEREEEFSLTETFSANMTVLDAGGAVQSSVADRTQLTWQLINGSSVHYTLLPPLETPALYDFQAHITSSSGTYTEARPWFLAVDPQFASTGGYDVELAALDNRTIVVAWIDSGTGGNATFAVYDTNGTQLVKQVLDTTGDAQSRISVEAINSTHFIIQQIDGPGTNNAAFYIYRRDGGVVQGRTALNANVGTNNDVATCELGDVFSTLYINDQNNQADFQMFLNDGTQTVAQTAAIGNVNPGAREQNLVDCAVINSTRWVYAAFNDQTNRINIALRSEDGTSIIAATNVDNSVGETAQVAATGLRNNSFALAYYHSTAQSINLTVINTASDTFDTTWTTGVDDDAGGDGWLSLAEIEDNGKSYIALVWQDATDNAIKATVYASDGMLLTPTFVVATQSATRKLIDIVGYSSHASMGLCPGTFIVVYANATEEAVFDRFFINGNAWNGSCEYTPPLAAYTGQTPPNHQATSNTSFIVNVSINESDLWKATWLWNGAAYALFDTTLLAKYNFNNVSAIGDTASLAVDVSSNGANATVTNANWTASGKHGGAYTFADAGYLMANISYAPLFTIGAWVKASVGSPADYQTVLNKEFSSSNRNFWLGLWTDGKARLQFSSSSSVTDCDAAGSTDLRDGRWHYLAGVYDGANCILYVDGVVKATDAVTATPQGVDANLSIGYAIGDAGRGLVGSIDEVTIFNTSMNTSAVQELGMSNLYKYAQDKWNFTINQSALKTGINTYQLLSTDITGSMNRTGLRDIKYYKYGLLDDEPAIDLDTTALDSTTVVVAWIDGGNYDANFQVWSTTGMVLVNETKVDTTGNSESRIAVTAINSTHFAIELSDGYDNATTLYIYNRSGQNVVDRTILNANVGTYTDTALCELTDSLAVLYANDNDNDADMQMYWNDGTQRTIETPVDGNMGPEALQQNLVDCASLNSDLWVYFWFDDASNYVDIAALNGDGTIVRGATAVDTTAGETAQVATMGVKNDVFGLLYYDSSTSEILFGIRNVTATVFQTMLANTVIDADAGADSRVSMTEVENTLGESYFVTAWVDSADNTIKAAIYDSNGLQITAPFVAVSDVSTVNIIDLVGTASLINTGLCTEKFGLAYVNGSYATVFKTFNLDGSVWNGVCDKTPANMTFTSPTLPDNSSTAQPFIAFNLTITEPDLRDIVLEWNRTSYTLLGLTTLLYFNFDNISALEESDTVVKDMSTNNFTATTNATLVAGKYGKAFWFNDSQAVILENNAVLDITQFTIASWIKADVGGPADYQTIISKEAYVSGDQDRNFWLGLWTDGKARLQFSSSSSVTDCDAAGSVDLRDGQWHYLVGVYDGADCTLYVDGMLDATDPVSAAPEGSGYNVSIGAELGQSGRGFVGSIDEVRVSRSAAPPELVQQFFISNLNKVNMENWTLFANETNLTPQNYNYIVRAVDTYGTTGVANRSASYYRSYFDDYGFVDVSMTALDSTTVVVAWIDEELDDASFKIMSTTGAQLIGEVDIDTDGTALNRIAVTPIDANKFAILLIDNSTVSFFIYNRTGGKVVDRTLIDASVDIYTDAAACELGTTLALLYANDNDNDADFQMYWNDGAQRTGENFVDGGMNPEDVQQNLIDCAALGATRWIYAWFDDGSNVVSMAARDETGTAVVGQTNVDGAVGETAHVAAAALRDNRFAYAFYDSTTSALSFTVRNLTGAAFGNTRANTVIDANTGVDSRVSVAEIESSGSSYFVVTWLNYNDSTIKAAVFNATGGQVTAPFNITTKTNTSLPLFSVVGYDSLLGFGLCDERFMIAYTNDTGQATLAGYLIDGRQWDGICDRTPPVIAFVSPTPPDKSSTTNDYVVVNVSINDSALGNVAWTWDDLQFVIYNDSTTLLINLDNVSALGESDSVVVDSSIYAKTGSATNKTIPADCKRNACAAFAANGLINFSSDTTNTLRDNFTISMWINDAAAAQDVQLDKGTYAIRDDYTGGDCSNPGRWQFFVNRSGTPICVEDTAAHPQNVWQHIVAVKNSTSINLYVDGTLKATTSASGLINENALSLLLAAGHDGSHFNGSIDEIAIYNRALNASEVQQLSMTFLTRYGFSSNISRWLLYSNTTNLSLGMHTYFVDVTDVSYNPASTGNRTISRYNTTFVDDTPFIDVDSTALDNVTVVVAWIDADSLQASFQVRNTNKTVIVGEIDVDLNVTTTSRISVTAINSTHFVVVVNDGVDQALDFYIYHRNGTLIYTSRISANIGTNTDTAVCELGDRFVITYANGANLQYDTQIYWNNGTRITAQTALDGNMLPEDTLQNLGDCAVISSTRWIGNWYDDSVDDVYVSLRNEVGTAVLGTGSIDSDVGDTGQVATTGMRNNTFVVVFYDATADTAYFEIRDVTGDSSYALIADNTIVNTQVGGQSRVSVAELDMDGKSYFVMTWWNSQNGTLLASVFNQTGFQITPPFVVDDMPSAYPLLDVVADDSHLNLGLCNGTFAIAYTNASSQAVLKTYFVNGTPWHGYCDFAGPDVTLDRPPTNGTITTLQYMVNATVSDVSPVVNVSFWFRPDNTSSWQLACVATPSGGKANCTWDLNGLTESSTYEIMAYGEDIAGNIGPNSTHYNITVSLGLPILNNMQCYKSGSWQSCTNVVYDNTLAGVRVNCTSEVATISNVTFNLTNIPDAALYFMNTTTNYTGGYLTLWLSRTINDSGPFTLTALCEDNQSGTRSSSTTWLVPWGTLTGTLLDPTSPLDVVQNTTFNFSARVSCTGGECGTANATLDPDIGWWNRNWSYRQNVTIVSVANTTLLEFPIFLSVAKDPFMSANYSDLRFLDGSCGNTSALLAFEIENYTDSDASIWVRVNVSLGNNSICMYYGNDNVSAADDRTGTWNSNYALVYHMNYTGEDSTSNARDRVANVGVPTNVSGYLGYGLSFDGRNDAWSEANLPYWETAFSTRTFEVVFETGLDINTRQVLFAEGSTTNGVMLYLLNGQLYARWWSETYGWTGHYFNTSVNSNTKYHSILEYRYPGVIGIDNFTFYLNGQVIGTNQTSANIGAHTANGGIAYTGSSNKDFHDLTGAGYYFAGTMYEFRALDTTVGKEYANQSYQQLINYNQHIFFSNPEPQSKGTIPMLAGDPFYTTTQNPQDSIFTPCLDILPGNTCDVSWIVNATGPISTVWEFFVIQEPNYYAGWYNASISNRVNITIVDKLRPKVQSISCQRNSTTWVGCSAIVYGNNITAVRANCTYSGGEPIVNATFTLRNVNDNNTYFSNTTFDNTTAYWLLNISQLILDGGNFSIEVNCSADAPGAMGWNWTNWTIPFGKLLGNWYTPTTNVNVTQHRFSTYILNISCSEGECGNITAELDPPTAFVLASMNFETPSDFANYDTDCPTSTTCVTSTPWDEFDNCLAGNGGYGICSSSNASAVGSRGLECRACDRNDASNAGGVYIYVNSTPCGGYPCQSLNLSFYQVVEGLDNVNEGSAVLVNDTDGTLRIAASCIDTDPYCDCNSIAGCSRANMGTYAQFVTVDLCQVLGISCNEPLTIRFTSYTTTNNLDGSDYLAWDNISLTGYVNKGTIPMVDSTPFYTTDLNPINATNLTCLANMQSGNWCLVSWNVNATGPLYSIHDLFGIFNSTYPITNITRSIRVNITGNYPPIVSSITLLPTLPVSTDNLNCSFKVTDANFFDNLSANITFYVNGTYFNSTLMNVTRNIMYSLFINNTETSPGDVWMCGVTPYDQYLWGNQTNSSNVSVLISQPPFITTIQCQEKSTWQSCSGVQYNEVLQGVRANCTDVDGFVRNVTFSLFNVEDNITFFTSTTMTKTAGYYTIGSLNINFSNSGRYNLSVLCYDDADIGVSNISNWTLPWGMFNVSWIQPTTNITMRQNQTGNFSVLVTCLQGECNNATVVLDPMQAYPYAYMDFEPGTDFKVFDGACPTSAYTCSDSSPWDDFDDCQESATPYSMCVSTGVNSGSTGARGLECRGCDRADVGNDGGLHINITPRFCNGYVCSSINVSYYQGTYGLTLATHGSAVWVRDADSIWRLVSNCMNGDTCESTTLNTMGSDAKYVMTDLCTISGIDCSEELELFFTSNNTVNHGWGQYFGWDKINITGYGEKGIIPMGSGTPFYTLQANPAYPANYSCLTNMSLGQNCTVYWIVNATGELGLTHEVFAYANSSVYPSYIPQNQSKHIYVTITGNVLPSVVDAIVFPIAPLNDSDLYCNFTITDTNYFDSLGANVTWYRNNVSFSTVQVAALINQVTSVNLTADNTEVGEYWHCGVKPFDETGYGNQTNSTARLILLYPPPSVDVIECSVSDEWGPCSRAIYYTNISQVRANCSSAFALTNVTFNLTNSPDNTTYFSNTTTDFVDVYFVLDNDDVNITDSGQFTLNVQCMDEMNQTATKNVNWTVPWGNLTGELLSPATATSVQYLDFFTFIVRVSCSGGECGDVNATLDPYNGTVLYDFLTGYTTDKWPYQVISNNRPPESNPVSRVLLSQAQTALINATDNNRWATGNPGANRYISLDMVMDLNESKSEITQLKFTFEGQPNNNANMSIYIYNFNTNQWNLATWQFYTADTDAVMTATTTNIADYVNQTSTVRWLVTQNRTADIMRVDYVSLNVTYQKNKGIISNITGSIPFYTTDPNPNDYTNISCLANLTAGESCRVTWNVNATGPIGSVHEFFAYFNATTYSSVNASQTPKVNITIYDAASVPPTVILLSPANLSYTNQATLNFTCAVSDNYVVENATLYADFNGTFQANESRGIGVAEANVSFNKTLADGTYVWNCLAYDNQGNPAWAYENWTVHIDTQPPFINLSAPENLSNVSDDDVYFNFTITDELSENFTCNLTEDGGVKYLYWNVSNDTFTSWNVSGNMLGQHEWFVSCIDLAGNYAESDTLLFNVLDFPPSVYLITQENASFNIPNVSLYYNATDLIGVILARLLLDGELNDTQNNPLNGVAVAFNVSGLTEGWHNWTVNVSDISSLSDQAALQQFLIDLSMPSILLNSPPDANVTNESQVIVNFTASDNYADILLCNLTVNDNIQTTDIIAYNTQPTTTNMTSLWDGSNYWNVTCSDDAGNVNVSETRVINVSQPPVVVLDSPADNQSQRLSALLLYYTPTDNTNISSCSLYLDGQWNQTEWVILNGVQHSFFVDNLIEATYEWNVTCNDTINLTGYSETRRFTVDRTGPIITLISPGLGDTWYGKMTNFTFNATDNVGKNITCNLTVDDTLQLYNQTIDNGSTVTFNTTITNEGTHYWNVSCTDPVGNSNTSETWWYQSFNPPSVTLVQPTPNALYNASTTIFLYIPSDENLTLAILVIDGVNNETNTSLISDVENSFTVSLPDGVHTWTVNVTDNNSLSTIPAAVTFTIDTTPPDIVMNTPLQDDVLTWNNVLFSFNVSDVLSSAMLCTITINDAPVFENIPASNGSTITRYKNFTDGNYNWSVLCKDSANNTHQHELVNFSVEAPPTITLNSPTDNARLKTTTPTFDYTPSDFFGITNCTLYINGTENGTNSSITPNVPNYFTRTLLEGDYYWTVICIDAYDDNPGTAPAENFTLDISGPSIVLDQPDPDTTFNQDFVFFNWTATDYSVLITCNLSIDGAVNVSGLNAVSPALLNTTVFSFPAGNHTWNVTCWDDLMNVQQSENRTFTINNPDLIINASAISFNETNPRENATLTISANVSNIGGTNAQDVLVQFFDNGVQISNSTNNITYNSSKVFTALWNITREFHDITVVIDPLDTITELDEDNNNATTNMTLLISEILDPQNDTWMNQLSTAFTVRIADFTGTLLDYTAYIDGNSNESGTANDNESFILNLDFFEGTHIVTVEARDGLSRRRNATPLTIHVDVTPPSPNITLPNMSWFNTTTPNITFIVRDNADLSINYTFYLNDTIIDANVTANNTPNYVILPSRPEGAYVLILEAIDEAGNAANTTPFTYFIDTTPPDIVLDKPDQGANFSTRNVTLNFTLTDNLAPNATYALILDTGEVAQGTIDVPALLEYNATDLVEGVHFWNVTARDAANNSNSSVTRDFGVYIAPIITLISPPNDSWTNNATVTFFFNLTEETGLENCSVMIEGGSIATKQGDELNTIGTNNITAVLPDGQQNWSIRCYDNTSMYVMASSEERTLNVDTSPPEAAFITLNESWYNATPVNISFTLSDDQALQLNYTIYVAGQVNATGQVDNATPSWDLLSLAEGYHALILEATDWALNRYNTTPLLVIVDLNAPNITLHEPLPGNMTDNENVTFNFTITDAIVENISCSLLVSGNDSINLTVTNNTVSNYTFYNLSAGLHYWNVTCWDYVNNTQTSSTRNFTIPRPDLEVNAAFITTNNTWPKENETIMINATVRNIGNTAAGAFIVQFFRTHPNNSMQIGDNVTIDSLAPGENVTLNITYTTILGINDIYVLADAPLPTGQVVEENESNNLNHKIIDVSSWNFISGNTSGLIALTNLGNDTIFTWNVENITGSIIYVIDADSAIHWTNLTALGRRTNGVSNVADFLTLDSILDLTNNSDSINKTYTSAGLPLLERNMTLYDKTVLNIPQANSTNTSDFLTGILWDAGDGGVAYTGAQDVVFVTTLNDTDTNDFEIRVPATLRSYTGSTDQVDFFVELR